MVAQKAAIDYVIWLSKKVHRPESAQTNSSNTMIYPLRRLLIEALQVASLVIIYWRDWSTCIMYYVGAMTYRSSEARFFPNTVRNVPL